MVWALFIVDDFEAEKKLKAAQAPNSFLSILMGKSGGEATDDRRPAPPSRSEAEMSESAAVFSDATRPELQAPEHFTLLCALWQVYVLSSLHCHALG